MNDIHIRIREKHCQFMQYSCTRQVRKKISSHHYASTVHVQGLTGEGTKKYVYQCVTCVYKSQFKVHCIEDFLFVILRIFEGPRKFFATPRILLN